MRDSASDAEPPVRRIRSALRRARSGILIMVGVYAVSIGAGGVMVHTGNQFALSYRDSLVARAHRADATLKASDSGRAESRRRATSRRTSVSPPFRKRSAG